MRPSRICCRTLSSGGDKSPASCLFSMAASPCLNAFWFPGGPLLPLTPPLPGMPAIVYLEPYRMIFVHSIRTIFVCSVRKTFGHLSDRAKKIEIYKALTLGHYIYNKVFVSRYGITAFASVNVMLQKSSRCVEKRRSFHAIDNSLQHESRCAVGGHQGRSSGEGKV